MTLPVQFAALTQATGQDLDDDFAAIGALTPIPCTVSGTNVLALTANTDTPAVTAYANYMPFSGVVVTSNTSAVTAAVGSLATLNVYKDSIAGPVALSGGELVAGNAFTLVYDLALNSGAGGFHAVTTTDTRASPSNPSTLKLGSGTSATITSVLSQSSTVTFTVIPANTTQDQNVTLTSVSIGDAVMLGPPSSVVSGVVFSAFVAAAGTVTVRAANVTAASLTPVAGLYRITTVRTTP